jgi:tetratricopeptide (TPR) repeat protein
VVYSSFYNYKINGMKKNSSLTLADKEKLGLLLLARGSELLDKAETLEDLQEAFSSLKNALKCVPEFSQAWIVFGKVNLKIAYHEENPESLTRAADAFLRGEALSKNVGNALSPETYWDWGNCLYWMGKQSEEAWELKGALDKYGEAARGGLASGSFYLDWGTAMGELGVLVGREELILEAAALLKKSIEIGGDNPTAWLRLACAYKILYFLSSDIGHFENADQSFVAAARNNAEPLVLWINWGQLLSLEGKTTRDPELLLAALEKLEKAHLIKPDDPIILTSLGDTLMHLGMLEDRFDYLKEAIGALELACSVSEDYPDPFCLFGHALANMGKYLSEPEYVEVAIEKFQMGISQNPNSHYFWHGLASACFILADLTHSKEEYTRAAKFCAEAIRLGGESPGYWNDWGVALMKLSELADDPSYLVEAVQKFEEAIHSFHRRSSGTPDPDWYYNYGCALDWLGDYELNPHYFERAIVILARLLDQYPDFHYVRYNLGLAFYHLGDVTGEIEPLEMAIEQFQIFLQQETEDDSAMADLGMTYLTLGDFLQESIPNEHSRAYFDLAESSFLKAIALGSGRSNYYLGCLYALKGNFPDAIHYMTRARKLKMLPPLEDLLQDEWLREIRLTPHFQNFLKLVRAEKLEDKPPA